MAGCNTPTDITNWNDLLNTCPQNPMALIASATLGSTTGTYLDSDTYSTPPSAWTTCTVGYNADPVCVANASENNQKVADAAQWNFQNRTRNSDSKLAPPLKNLIFLRAGTDWKMEIELALGSNTFTDIQLSFRNNAATRGDKHSNIPVISFTGASFTGNTKLTVTLKYPTISFIGMRLIDNSGNWCFFSMEWAIIL